MTYLSKSGTFQGQGARFSQHWFQSGNEATKKKQSKEELIRPAENDQSKAVLPPLTVLSDTPHCSSFQFDVLMNCGNSDPAHPSYPHGRLEAARINTAVKNGKGLISHYNINLTKTLDIYIPNWHEGWYFNLFVLFESYFVSWTFIKNFQKKNWRWKLTSIGLIWHPSQLIRSYKSSP